MSSSKTLYWALVIANGAFPTISLASSLGAAQYAELKSLEPISVIATKGDRLISDVPHSVTLIDSNEISRRNSKDIAWAVDNGDRASYIGMLDHPLFIS